MQNLINNQWRIAKRPDGNVKITDFELHQEQVPTLNNGEFLLKTLH